MKLVLALLLILSSVGFASESADADWNAVTALDAGPTEPINSRDDARRVGLAFLARQEAALRKFIVRNPGDPRVVDAQLRLAQLLTTKSDLSENPKIYLSAVELLDSAFKTAPETRKADVTFGKIVITMRQMPIPTESEREMLTGMMYAFQKRYPNDRRVGPLMVEIATLYDNMPKRKEALLNEALQNTRSEEIRSRIGDDLKRLHLLGRSVEVQGVSVDGTKIDIAEDRGKVVIVYFFASWSPPSLAGLEEVAYLRKSFSPKQVAIIGVSLDPTREALSAALKPLPFSLPVIWESKGWESPLIRGFGLNALPTLWIFDKKGRLQTLNAKTESSALIQRLLK